jgi:NitT/TauT family transport system permease protein
MPSDVLSDHAPASGAVDARPDAATRQPEPAWWTKAIPLVAPPIVLVVALLAAWQVATFWLAIPQYILPSPVAIWQAIVENFGDLMRATANTFVAAIAGFLLSIVIGNGVALMMAGSKWIQRSIYPYAVVLQTIPIVAVAPLIVIWFGSGLSAIVIISFIIAVFPIISSSNLGLSATDANLVQLMRMYGGGGWRMMWKLRIPFALPYILGGMKISCGAAVIGAIIGEFVAGIGGAQAGLGIAITSAAVQMQTAYLFACAITASLMGVLFFLVVAGLAHLMLRNWHESAMASEE